MPTFADRAVALTFCILFGCVCYAGKASVFVLHFMTFTLVLLHLWNVGRPSKVISDIVTADIAVPTMLLTMFAAYASLSSLWAADPAEAFSAGLRLFASIVACQIMLAIISKMPIQTLVLIAGWQIVGFGFGLVFIWIELKTDYQVTMWFANRLLGTTYRFGSMSYVNDGKLVNITYHVANWAVAAANILLWPVIAFAYLLFGGAARKAVIATLFTTVAILTYTSDHQSSQVGFPIAALFVVFGIYCSQAARRLLVVGCVFAFALIVPASQYMFHKLELDRASWAHPSLQARVIIWGVTADNVYRAPILGIGAKSTREWGLQNNFPTKAEDGRIYPLTPDAHAHNNYLQVWFELGAVGATLLCAATVLLLNAISKLHRDIAPFAIGMAAIILIISLVSWSVWNSWLSASFALALATLLHGDRIARADPPIDVRRLYSKIWLPERSK